MPWDRYVGTVGPFGGITKTPQAGKSFGGHNERNWAGTSCKDARNGKIKPNRDETMRP